MSFVPEKTICDICGKEIEHDNYSVFPPHRKKYVMVVIEPSPYVCCRKTEKTKIDICPQCYNEMVSWVRSKRKKENNDAV